MAEVLSFVPLLLAGVVLLYALGQVLATLTIWLTKSDNITIAMAALLEAGRYPVQAYPAAYRAVFTFVIPAAAMTTVPASALSPGRGLTWTAAAASLFAAAALLIFSRWFWRFALRHYTSASS